MEINISRNEITTCYVAPKWLALFNQMENFKLKTMNLFIINHDPYDPIICVHFSEWLHTKVQTIEVQLASYSGIQLRLTFDQFNGSPS